MKRGLKAGSFHQSSLTQTSRLDEKRIESGIKDPSRFPLPATRLDEKRIERAMSSKMNANGPKKSR